MRVTRPSSANRPDACSPTHSAPSASWTRVTRNCDASPSAPSARPPLRPEKSHHDPPAAETLWHRVAELLERIERLEERVAELEAA